MKRLFARRGLSGRLAPTLLPLLWLGISPLAPAAPELAAAAQASATSDDEAAETLRTIVTDAQHPYLTWPLFPPYQDEMEALYSSSDYGLLWFADGRMTEQASDVIDVLLAAARRGLHPEDYDAERLAEIRDDRQRYAESFFNLFKESDQIIFVFTFNLS